MRFAEVISTIEGMKKTEDGIYGSLLEREIALEKIERANEAYDEVISYLKSIQAENGVIYG